MMLELPPQNDQLAIHTIFLPRENILFIKEWIAYHIAIGVSHFYLYDNSGSMGRSVENPLPENINKYNIDYHDPTSHFNDDDIQNMLQELAVYFDGYITYVPWDERDNNGRILYAQNKSITHYYNHFSSNYSWTAFIDIDEFIFSERYDHIGNFLNHCNELGWSDIQIIQKKFAERFLYLDRYVTEIASCIDNVDTRNWSPKHIIRNDRLDGDRLNNHVKGKRWGIHNIPVIDRNIYHASPEELRFNHYNVNEILLKWMKEKTIRKLDFFLDGFDDGMKKYYDFVNCHSLRKSASYNNGAKLDIMIANQNKAMRHLVFNEPLSFKNLTSHRFLLRMAKELFKKMV